MNNHCTFLLLFHEAGCSANQFYKPSAKVPDASTKRLLISGQGCDLGWRSITRTPRQPHRQLGLGGHVGPGKSYLFANPQPRLNLKLIGTPRRRYVHDGSSLRTIFYKKTTYCYLINTLSSATLLLQKAPPTGDLKQYSTRVGGP